MAIATLGAATTVLLLACGTEQQHATNAVTSTVLAAKPVALHWDTFQGIRLPSAQQGPTRLDGAVVGGFERSPVGAALAAIHATVRISVATDAQWIAVVKNLVAPGVGRDAWTTARAQISITTPVANDPPAVLGYRVTHYTPDTAEIDIYTLNADNSVNSNTCRVRWQANDWRLELPDNPATHPVRVLTLPPPDMIALAPR
ncbi:hypothetical protein [Nocardia fusca]|uniref:hypothetical protein n=1 Tax=Nocardia fusca TaxID=941183 RepID=UPI0007A76367|nr:hypothetical protein [Nocardia fusca]